MLWKFCALTLLMALSTNLLAQPVDLTGQWKGVLTQREGGYRSEYQFEIYLIHDKDEIRGRSYVAVENIEATMVLTAEFSADQLLRFRESGIIQATELQNLEWCLKTATLKLKRQGNTWKLIGEWRGQAPMGPCIPGKIFLTRVIPRA